MKPEKLYRCPACGHVITDKIYKLDLETGGPGYCNCEFSAVDENGEIWYPRIYHEYDVYHLKERVNEDNPTQPDKSLQREMKEH